MNQNRILLENSVSQEDALVVVCLLLALFGFLSYWWAHYGESLHVRLN